MISRNSKIPARAGFDFIAFLPHAVPSIVFGVGALLLTLFVLQRALPLYGTVWILLIVFTIARISYGTRMTNSGLIQIHAELEESAQMSGATLGQGFRRISVPLLAPTLLYAWLWIALLTFRELTLAVMRSILIATSNCVDVGAHSGSVLRHIVTHSTYHRGQAASKLKRFGIEQPNTDFFFWAIEQVPQGA